MSAPENGSPRSTVVLRPLGSPVPLGFGGLAIATLVLTGLELGWVPLTEGHQVGLLVLVAAVPLQALACVLAFLARDGAAGSTMGMLVVGWLGTGLIHLTSPPGSTSSALGLLLVAVGGILLGSVLVLVAGKPLPALVVGLTATRFALTGLHELTAGSGWQTASGWVGVAVLVAAVYTVLAAQLEDSQQRNVLPTFRHVEQEPGVRAHL